MTRLAMHIMPAAAARHRPGTRKRVLPGNGEPKRSRQRAAKRATRRGGGEIQNSRRATHHPFPYINWRAFWRALCRLSRVTRHRVAGCDVSAPVSHLRGEEQIQASIRRHRSERLHMATARRGCGDGEGREGVLGEGGPAPVPQRCPPPPLSRSPALTALASRELIKYLVVPRCPPSPSSSPTRPRPPSRRRCSSRGSSLLQNAQTEPLRPPLGPRRPPCCALLGD